MSLQLIMGSSGSEKSKVLYEGVIEESVQNQDTSFLVIVPEQFTMSTQRKLVINNKNKGIMNIDVMSFQRLAYRVFNETGCTKNIILTDEGKNLIIKKIARQFGEELKVLGANLKKTGYISEVKSFISEMFQYRITPEDIEKLIKEGNMSEMLKLKLKDLVLIYRSFNEYLSGDLISAEELLEILAQEVQKSGLVRNSVIVLDGFTGFTPVQYRLISQLMKFAKKLVVSVTIDGDLEEIRRGEDEELFKLSKDTVYKLYEIANEKKIEILKPVVLKGSTRFNPKGELCYLEKNIFRYNKEKCNSKKGEISLHVCSNPQEEMEFVCSQINNLVMKTGLRYKDIAIVSGDVANYGRCARSIFVKYNIPCFIDEKKNILNNPFVETIRAVLEIVCTNFNYEPVFRYVKSGLLSIDCDKIYLLENYCIAYGKKGYNTWTKEWKAKGKGFSEEDLEIINEIRNEIIDSFAELVLVLKNNKTTVREKITALYNFFVLMEFQKKIKEYEDRFNSENERGLAKEYSQVYKKVMELFDKYVELMGNESMDLLEFIEILDSGFEEIKIGIIPPGFDMVLMGDIERTRLEDIKVLFFVGVNDGIIPAVDNKGGIISDAERESLMEMVEIAPTARQKLFTQRFYLYLNMTKPTKHLYVSYSRLSSQGTMLKSSYLIGMLKKMFPNVVEYNEAVNESVSGRVYSLQSGLDCIIKNIETIRGGEAGEDVMAVIMWYLNSDEGRKELERILEGAFYKNEEKMLHPEIALRIYGEMLRISISKVESFNKCAYYYFLKHGLKLKEREEFTFESFDYGNLIHSALDIFTGKMINSEYDWTDLPDDIKEEMCRVSLEEAESKLDSDVLHSTKGNEFLIKRIQKVFDKTVWALSEQMKKGSFETVLSEVGFKIEKEFQNEEKKIVKMLFDGRIDRVDTCVLDNETIVKVIDYKTGSQGWDLNKVYHGLALQLVAYMSGAIEILKKSGDKNVITPGGIYYYGVDNPTIESTANATKEKIESEVLKKLKLKGLTNSREDIISKIDEGVYEKSTVVPVEIKKDGDFGANSKVADTESFEKLLKYNELKIAEAGREIISGEILTNPYSYDGKTGCDYCSYKAICKFDLKIKGCNFRELSKVSEEEVWENIDKTIDESGK